MFSTPPDISLPTTKPPCPWNTVQLSTIRLRHGRARRRPSSSFPDFMQMASSPTSNEELSTSTSSHESMSSPSPFWEYHGLRTVILLIITFLHISGWIFQQGEFWKRTSSRSTFSHSLSPIITGRRYVLTDSQSSSVSIPCGTLKASLTREPLNELESGYQTSPFALVNPPEASSSFHCEGAILDFLTCLQASPDPSIVPPPVMEMFFAPTALTGEMHLRVSSPSNTVSTIG